MDSSTDSFSTWLPIYRQKMELDILRRDPIGNAVKERDAMQTHGANKGTDGQKTSTNMRQGLII